MSKPVDSKSTDREDMKDYKSGLARDVRSMLEDFSRTQKDQAQKSRNERQAFLIELRNHTASLRAGSRISRTAPVAEAEAVPAEASVVEVEAVIEAIPVAEVEALPAEASVVEVESAIETVPAVDVEALPQAVATVPISSVADEVIVKASVTDGDELILMAPVKQETSDWLRETILGPSPRKTAPKTKRTKKK